MLMIQADTNPNLQSHSVYHVTAQWHNSDAYTWHDIQHCWKIYLLLPCSFN